MNIWIRKVIDMESKELIFDAVSALSARHIEEAAGYELKKEGRPLPRRMAYAAAACLALFAAAFGVSRIIRPAENEPNGAVAALPSATTAETAAPTEAPRIVFGEEGSISETMIPGEGDVLISLKLKEALEDESNEGCLFYVCLSYYGLGNYYKVDEEWRGSWREFYTPLIEQFFSEYNEWQETHEVTCEEAHRIAMADYEELLYPMMWITGKDLTEKLNMDREEVLMESFADIWKETKPAEVWEEFIETKRRMDDRWKNDKRPDVWQFQDQAMHKEYNRLVSLGFPIETDENGSWRCLVTKEQIEAFPADPNGGYLFKFPRASGEIENA